MDGDSTELPNELLIEIGRFATDWAVIEQEIMLHASALAAKDTGGIPAEYLRMDFKRLREKWYALAKANLGEAYGPELMTLNDRLARRSRARGYALHGKWRVLGPQRKRVECWDQKRELKRFQLVTTLAELQDQTDRLRELLGDLVDLSRRAHGPKN